MESINLKQSDPGPQLVEFTSSHPDVIQQVGMVTEFKVAPYPCKLFWLDDNINGCDNLQYQKELRHQGFSLECSNESAMLEKYL